MTPTGPSGCHCSYIRWRRPLASAWSGRRAGATGRPRSRPCRSSPAPRRGPRLRILPTSRVTRSPRSSWCWRRRRRELAHDLAAARRGPLPPLEERLLRGARDLFVLVARGETHARDRFAGRGIDRGQRRPRGGDRLVGPGAVARGLDAESVEHGRRRRLGRLDRRRSAGRDAEWSSSWSLRSAARAAWRGYRTRSRRAALRRAALRGHGDTVPTVLTAPSRAPKRMTAFLPALLVALSAAWSGTFHGGATWSGALDRQRRGDRVRSRGGAAAARSAAARTRRRGAAVGVAGDDRRQHGGVSRPARRTRPAGGAARVPAGAGGDRAGVARRRSAGASVSARSRWWRPRSPSGR